MKKLLVIASIMISTIVVAGDSYYLISHGIRGTHVCLAGQLPAIVQRCRNPDWHCREHDPIAMLKLTLAKLR
jgi:hypothetical protein